MKKTAMLILVIALLMSVLVACDSSDDTIQASEGTHSGSNYEENKTPVLTNEGTDSNSNAEDDKPSVLTIENCPELKAVLYSKDASGEEFATKYDGRFVEFEACIFENSKSSATLDRTITVTGEFSADGEASGWVIKIGSALGASIDESVVRGDFVIIKGRVNADRTEFYKCLYITTESLSKKN